MVIPSDPYLKHFDGYLESMDDDTSLFLDTPTLGPTPEQEPDSPKLLWYLGHHAKEVDDSKSELEGLPDLPSEPCAGSHAMDIERLLDPDSQQASTQTKLVSRPQVPSLARKIRLKMGARME